MSMETLVNIRNLKVSFRLDRSHTFEAVKGISFDVPKNATVALVGESGSGKSVTSLAVLGLLPRENSIIDPGSRIEFDGRNVVELPAADLRGIRGSQISMIFQEPMTSLNPVFTVGYQLTEVLRLHMGMRPAQARKRAIELLDEVGIPDPEYKVNAYPSQMSGGQQQRVMIAMAIACEPKLLIADEPTTALDVTVQAQILKLLQELRRDFQTAVVMITHDLGVVAGVCDDVLVMYAGRTMEYGPVQSIFDVPSHPYTRGLLHAVPRMDHAHGIDRLATIPGNPPNLLALPPGCPFAPRCHDRFEACLKPAPLIEFAGSRRRACHRSIAELSGSESATEGVVA